MLSDLILGPSPKGEGCPMQQVKKCKKEIIF
jgi:hypothetical protein